MGKLRLTCWMALAWASALGAQDLPLTVRGETLTVVQRLPFTITAPAECDLYFWSFPAGVAALDRGEALEVTAAPKGALTITVKALKVEWDQKKITKRFGSITFAVGEVPGPQPPPGPDPPVPGQGVKVMILEESKHRTAAWAAMVFSKQLRDFLNAKTVLDADNKTRAWTIQDKDEDLSAYFPGWKELQARPRTELPWLIIADTANRPVFEGPLPKTLPETMALLDKHLGGK